MVRTRRWNFVKVTAISTVLALLGGCTSWHDYFHQGFKVGPDYQSATAPVAPNGSMPPTPASARLRPIRANGGASFTIRCSTPW